MLTRFGVRLLVNCVVAYRASDLLEGHKPSRSCHACRKQNGLDYESFHVTEAGREKGESCDSEGGGYS